LWAGIKYALVSGEIMPGVGAISMEGAALARSGLALERSAQELAMLGPSKTKVLEGAAEGVAYRVPDLLGVAQKLGFILGEAKDVAKLALTGQMRDAFRAAEELGANSCLFIGKDSALTKTLIRQVVQSRSRVFRRVDNEWVDVTAELAKGEKLR